MTRKQLTLLVVLLLVLGGAGLALYKNSTASWQRGPTVSGERVVKFRLNDVTNVAIKQSGTAVNLAKKSDVWSVEERQDYPANFETVSALIRKVWELKPTQEVKVGPSQLARLDLAPAGEGTSTATRVEFKDKDGKQLAALLLGKQYLKQSEGMGGGEGGYPAGRYVISEDGSKRVLLVSETFSEIVPKPEQWLDREFIKVEKPKSIALTGTGAGMNWKLTRDNETSEWKLADAKPDEQLDTSKTSAFASIFSSPSFVDVMAPDAKPEATGLDRPASVTIETFDNINYTIKVGKETGDAFPVSIAAGAELSRDRVPAKDEKPEDKAKLDADFQTHLKQLEEKVAKEKKFEKRVYLLAKTTLESLLKPRAQLLVEKKPEPAATPAPATPAASPGASPSPKAQVTTEPVAAPEPAKKKRGN